MKFGYAVKEGKENNVAFIRPLPRRKFTKSQIESISSLLKKEDYVKEIKFNGASLEVVFHHGKSVERIEIINNAVPLATPLPALIVPPKLQTPKPYVPIVHITKAHAEDMLIAYFSIKIKENGMTSFDQMVDYLTGKTKTFLGEFDARWHFGMIGYTSSLENIDKVAVSEKMKKEYLSISDTNPYPDTDYENRMSANREFF
jgi:hypothetical protein